MILVVGTADWDQAIATNQHYMVRELSKRYEVIFSESLGLRRPDLSRRDLSRMARRLLKRRQNDAFRRSRPAGVTVVKPVIFPIHGRWTRLANTLVLRFLYRHWLNFSGPRVLWTYSPVTYGFERFADVSVYHCVDLLAEFPQISSSLIVDNEMRISSRVDLGIASSPVVEDHLRAAGFHNVIHWPNVADVEALRVGHVGEVARNAKRAVFAGNLSDKKIDFDLLDELVEAGVDLHLAGPISEGGGNSKDRLQLLVANGATYHGLLPLEDLGALYSSATVGLIPYVLNAYTTGVSPLKTFEYLATGLHVISTQIPAVRELPGHVTVSQRTAFVSDVVENLVVPCEDVLLERQKVAADNSWAKRGATARDLVRELLDGVKWR